MGKPLIFQTWILLSNRMHRLKYLRSLILVCQDIGIRKSEFVAKTQFLYIQNSIIILILKCFEMIRKGIKKPTHPTCALNTIFVGFML